MGIAAGDLNCDAPPTWRGKLGVNNVSTLLNFRRAAFSSARRPPTTGTSPYEATATSTTTAILTLSPPIATATPSVVSGQRQRHLPEQIRVALPAFSPQSVAVGDVNGDATSISSSPMRAAIRSASSATVTALQEPVRFPWEPAGRCHARRFNHDGKTDLAVATARQHRRRSPRQWRRHLQNQRTFGVGPEPVPGRATLMATATGPAVTNFGFTNYYGVSSLTILLGNGNGTFLDQQTTRRAPTRARSLSVISTRTAARRVCRSKRRSSQRPLATATAPSRRISLHDRRGADVSLKGDFNADSILDLAVTNTA